MPVSPRGGERTPVAESSAQAEDYAAALGMRIGRVLRVSERSARSVGDEIVVRGTRAYAPAPPVQPGEQDVSVTVWIDYAFVPAT